jgi:DNA modification methylase
MTYQILLGNNLDILPTLPDNSVDSIVTDPPYELGFMGKKWDSSGIAYSVELWQQCLRVLKPGGHLLSFGGTRTWHRVAVGIEDAGFEIRDSMAWLYGSGFPKSLDVAKAIDKQSGYQGEVVGTEVVDVGMQGGSMHAGRGTKLQEREIKELSLEAQQWQGWGTALKPAFEPIVVARKPIEGTVANNVLKWGTGGLNIDGSRIGTDEVITNHSRGSESAISKGKYGNSTAQETHQTQGQTLGRWPANVILDPYTAELLDEQSGDIKGRVGMQKVSSFQFKAGEEFAAQKFSNANSRYDSGGASRFFYVAKASKKDRNEGLDELPLQVSSNYGSIQERSSNPAKQNFHPTVKPTTLMEYLIKLVTPPGGVVLDPFTGSGSTGKAAILQGFDFIGIEMTEEYLPIIEGRLKHAEQLVAEAKEQDKLKENEVLF